MTEQRSASPDGWFARWREHRRAKRQQSLERRYFEHERMSSSTSAYVSAGNHAGQVDAYTGGSGVGGLGDGGGGGGGGDG